VGKHRAPGTQSSAHPWLRRLTAGLSITTLLLTALSGGAVYALSGLGKNIGAVDTSTLEEKYRPKAVVQTDTSPMNLLIMGSDSREGDGNDAYGSFGGARSDTTLLVHLYEGRKDAVVVSIPRDSWVEIAGCTQSDGSKTYPYKTKFNAAFAFGGPVCTIKTVEKLTDVRIDNFVVVDFKAFKTVVDAIGGVEVCLTTPAYDPVVPGRGGSGLNLPAGYSTISGEQALAFVRARESLGDGSDLSRIERQQDFIGSMIRGMTEKGLLKSPQMIYRVLAAITSSIEANPEFANIQALQEFTLSLGGLSPSRIKFVTLPYELKGDGNVHWYSETEKLWEAIRDDEPWPAVDSPTDPSKLEPATKPSDIDVAVLNAAGTAGLAKTAAAELEEQGYNLLKVGNSTKQLENSEILYKSENFAQAKALGKATGITKLTLDSSLISPIVILIGQSWVAGELKPFESASQSSATPSPTPTDTSGTAASTVCTEGNNRVKK
jgi:LCP family protein required for cell wall assembly